MLSFGPTANLGSRCYDFGIIFVEEHMAEREFFELARNSSIAASQPGTALVLPTVTITKTLGYNQP
jgi:hypothetical protein